MSWCHISQVYLPSKYSHKPPEKDQEEDGRTLEQVFESSKHRLTELPEETSLNYWKKMRL